MTNFPAENGRGHHRREVRIKGAYRGLGAEVARLSRPILAAHEIKS
jgi:hypothetical protein